MTPTRALVFNPAAGGRLRKARVDRLAEALGGAARVELLPTERQGHAAELVADFLGSRPGPVELLALGGDGTLNEVAWGAYLAAAFDRVSVGILPGGTTNVVARSLGVPLAAERAVAAFLGGADRLLDVGTCEVAGAVRPFLLACGAGFDAEVLQEVSSWLKRAIGRHAYTVSALRACRHRAPFAVRWSQEDGGGGEASCASLIVGNAPLYAGKLRLAPGASPDDGALEMALLPSTRLHSLIRAGLVAQWRDLRAAGVRVERALSVEVTQPGIALHVDAELIGCSPARVGILPRALKVRVPFVE